MNDNELDMFLRNTRPEVKEDPYFILETRRRLAAVEGIKHEVELQHRRGRIALLATLVAGIAAVAILVVLFTILPVDAFISNASNRIAEAFSTLPVNWKLFLPVTFAAATLALVFILTRRRSEVRF